MKRGTLLLALAALLLLTSTALAQTGDGYDLSWWTVDGGGESSVSQGDGFVLIGTIGQVDAGMMDAEPYALFGGFLAGGAEISYDIFLPLLMRSF